MGQKSSVAQAEVWAPEYANLRQAESGAAVNERDGTPPRRSRSPRSPSQSRSPSQGSGGSSNPTPTRSDRFEVGRTKSERRPSRLQDYRNVKHSELWRWLWLDFSVPSRSPIQDTIRKNISSHNMINLEDSPCLSPIGEESVGMSRMVTQVLKPMGEGSVLAGVFTLVSSAMGAGCLSLPFMMKRSGIILGFLMLVLGALMAHLSLVVLMSCARYTESHSMARLVSLARDPKSERQGQGPLRRLFTSSKTVDVVIAVYGIAAVLCYLIFIGDFFTGIARSSLINSTVSRETLIVTVAVCVVWPLSLPRSLTALRYVCVVSVMAICLTAVAVACKAPGYMARGALGASTHLGEHSMERAEEAWVLKWWDTDWRSALQSFSISLFAFAAHTNAVPVATSLKRADPSSIWCVSLYSVCIELVFYVLMGLGGYLSFRGLTKQDFILNYRNDDVSMFAVRCVYGVVVCLGAPINLSPAASSIQGLLRGDGAKSSCALHFVVVTVIIAGCTFVALLDEHIADVIGLIGASFGTLIVLAWPAMVYRKTLYHLHPKKIRRVVFYSLASAATLGFVAFASQAAAAWTG